MMTHCSVMIKIPEMIQLITQKAAPIKHIQSILPENVEDTLKNI